MKRILNHNPEQIVRCNRKKSWPLCMERCGSSEDVQSYSVDFLWVKKVQSPNSVWKLLQVPSVFTEGSCAVQVVKLLCMFCVSLFPRHANIRQSKCCGVLGCSRRKRIRKRQPFLTVPTYFSNSLFHVLFGSSSDYPREPRKRPLVAFCIRLGLGILLFLYGLFDHQPRWGGRERERDLL